VTENQKLALPGVLAFVFSLINPLSVVTLWIMFDGVDSGRIALSLLIFFIVPGFLVAVGSYIHSFKREKIGFILLILGALIFIGELPFLLFCWVLYFLWVGWLGGIVFTLMFVPNICAIMTMIASIRQRRRIRAHA
jgi:hypothetical protein